MANSRSARAAFLDLVSELDPDAECFIPEKPAQGNYLIELTRSGEKQIVKVSEKDLLAFEKDENIRDKIEERVLSALEKLPELPASEEDAGEEFEVEEEDLEDEEMEEEVPEEGEEEEYEYEEEEGEEEEEV